MSRDAKVILLSKIVYEKIQRCIKKETDRIKKMY